MITSSASSQVSAKKKPPSKYTIEINIQLLRIGKVID